MFCAVVSVASVVLRGVPRCRVWGCLVACVLRPLTVVPVGSLSRCRPASVGPFDARLRRLPYAAAYPYEKGFASVTRAYSANPQDR